MLLLHRQVLIFIFLPILTCPLLVVFEEDLEGELNPKKIGEFDTALSTLHVFGFSMFYQFR